MPSPFILTVNWLDPTGIGGLAADVETAASLGCHPLTIASALGDGPAPASLSAITPGQITTQLRALLDRVRPQAVKLGPCGDATTVEVLYTALAPYPDIPVVLDLMRPAGSDILGALRALLLPRTTLLLITPTNARLMMPEGDSPEASAMAMLDLDCDGVAMMAPRQMRYYADNRVQETLETFWTNAPLAEGVASTLSTALTALLAQGEATAGALRQACAFTAHALSASRNELDGQAIPNRLFWADSDDHDA